MSTPHSNMWICGTLFSGEAALTPHERCANPRKRIPDSPIRCFGLRAPHRAKQVNHAFPILRSGNTTNAPSAGAVARYSAWKYLLVRQPCKKFNYLTPSVNGKVTPFWLFLIRSAHFANVFMWDSLFLLASLQIGEKLKKLLCKNWFAQWNQNRKPANLSSD